MLLPICKIYKNALLYNVCQKWPSFILSNDHFLNTKFDFDTSSDKTNGKLQNGNENYFDIAEVS